MHRRRLVCALALAGSLLGGATGCPARDDGTALLTNTSARDDLHLYVLDGDGEPLMDGALDPVFRFDTQDPDRERQCLVAGDGSFEVRGADGEVLIEHDFADREICELQELEVTDDLTLEWID